MKEQIEEIARIICTPTANKGNCEKCGFKKHCSKFDDATALYNAGYRKEQKKLEPIGRWVLVKPRRINRNATYKCSLCGKLCSSYYNDVGEWKSCPHCRTRMGGVEVQCKNKLRKS